MKALTIWQPWAELIASGAKRVENRTWRTAYRGPLAIHAGTKRIDVSSLREPERIAMVDTLPFGAVVAVVTLLDCLPIDELPRRCRETQKAFIEGPICWWLSAVRRIDPPIAMIGMPGLFNLPSDIAERVSASIITASI